MAYEATPFDSYTTAALEQAQGLMTKPLADYPEYVPSQTKAPAQMDYYNYTPTSAIAQINQPNYQMSAEDTPAYSTIDTNAQVGNYSWNNWTPQTAPTYQTANTDAATAAYNYQKYGTAAPTYQGLMGGDYAKLQQALTTPGQIEATNAYNQGTQNLINTMSGNGLYGSSIMQQQQQNGLDKVYQQALATNAANAAATRYGMQQTDLTNANAQNLAAWQSNLAENQSMNEANLGYAQLQTGVNQQNVANALTQTQALNALASGDYQALNSLLSAQNIAQNSNALSYADLQTQTNLQNVANALAQSQSMNAYNQAARAQDLEQENNINAFAAQNFATDVGQQANVYSANSTDASNMNAYNAGKLNWDLTNATNQTNWENANAYEQYTYDIAKNAYNNSADETLMNRALALAGQGAPLVSSATNYQIAQEQADAARQAASEASSAQNTATWLGLGGTVAGGLLGNWKDIFG